MLAAAFAGTTQAGDSSCGQPEYDPFLGTFTPAVFFLYKEHPFSCPEQVLIFVGHTGIIHIDFYNSCTGEVDHGIADDGETTQEVLSNLCGPGWANQYGGPAGAHSPALPAFSRPRQVSSAAPIGGQGSQTATSADLNGDGNPDFITAGAGGITVQLRASDGSVLSTRQFPAGFPIANPLAAHVVAADFNGDGKIDLAVSNLGNVGSDPGGVSILLGKGDGTFGAPNYIRAGFNPLAMAVADFNGDGKLDLAVGNQWSGNTSGGVVVYGPGTVSLLMGNGDGTFQAPVAYPTGEDSSGIPVSLVAVDLNGDGLPDIAAANRNDSSVSILLNSGGGKLKAPAVIATAPYDPHYLAFADLNADGKPDLLAAAEFSNAVLVLTGKGDGSFQTPAAYAAGNGPATVGVVPGSDGASLIVTVDAVNGAWFTSVSAQGVVGAPLLARVGGSPAAVAAGDLNGDGLPDAVVVGASSDVAVLLGQKTQFANPVGYSLGGVSPRAVAIADFNKDGKPDVITANAPVGQNGSVTVLLGNGDGSLRTPVTTPIANQSAQSIAIADFNGDGKLDVAVAAAGTIGASSDPGGVNILFGKGDGTFQAGPVLTASGLHPEAVAAGDLNGDGIPDLAVLMGGTTGQPATLAVFLGQSGGTYQAARTFALKTTFGSTAGIAIGDLNGDGKPDIAAVANFGQQIDVLLGDGAGEFKEAASLPSLGQTGAGGLLLTDLDGDGKLDLATPYSVFPGNGDGTFQAEQLLLSGASPTGIAAARINGVPTLIAVNQGGSLVPVGFEQPAAPSLTITSNVSAAATTLATIAPGSIATAFGINLATTTAVPSGAPPLSLGGATVNIHDAAGVDHAAPLFYVSPTQVNYEVPDTTALGSATITIDSGSGLKGSITTPVAGVAPGIFPLNTTGLAAAIVLIVAADGSQSFGNVYQVGASNSIVAQPVDLSQGQVYLELYGTGVRNARNVTVTIAGQSVPIYSFGPQVVFAGLDQINVGPLPASLKGRGQVNLVLAADGQAANTVNITFQ